MPYKEWSFERRRRWRIRSLQIGGPILLAILAAIARHWAVQFPEFAALEAWVLKTTAGWVQTFVASYPNSPTVTLGIAVFGLCIAASLKYTPQVYERLFEEYDNRVMTWLPSPKSFDPLRGVVESRAIIGPHTPGLGFVNGGAKKALFGEISSFITSGFAVPRTKRHDSQNAINFGWLLIAGDSGMGKSRIAMEVARSFRGADQLRGRHTFVSWLRIRLLQRQCRATDGFDVGWLNPPSSAKSRPDFTKPYQHWLDRRSVAVDNWAESALSKWLPRYPTILILDDPREGDAELVINILGEKSSKFLCPVRLLIVNQTKARELLENQSVRSAFRPPIYFDSRYKLTQDDVDQILRNIEGPHAGPGAIRKILEISNGVPLLVECAVAKLRDGTSLDDLTGESVVAHRVDRLIEALTSAGIDSSAGMIVLAAATLADGVSLAEVEAIVPGLRIEPDVLIAAFPATISFDPHEAIPAIRPRFIGDAFVTRILTERSSRALTERVVELAWRCNPQAVSDAIIRIWRGAFATLPAALLKPPPMEIGDEQRLTVTMRLVTQVVFMEKGILPEVRGANQSSKFMQIARDYISSFPEDSIHSLLRKMLQIAEERDITVPFRGYSWISLCCYCFRRMADSGSVNKHDCLDEIAQFTRIAASYMGNMWSAAGVGVNEREYIALMLDAKIDDGDWIERMIVRLADEAERNSAYFLFGCFGGVIPRRTMPKFPTSRIGAVESAALSILCRSTFDVGYIKHWNGKLMGYGRGLTKVYNIEWYARGLAAFTRPDYIKHNSKMEMVKILRQLYIDYPLNKIVRCSFVQALTWTSMSEAPTALEHRDKIKKIIQRHGDVEMIKISIDSWQGNARDRYQDKNSQFFRPLYEALNAENTTDQRYAEAFAKYISDEIAFMNNKGVNTEEQRRRVAEINEMALSLIKKFPNSGDVIGSAISAISLFIAITRKERRFAEIERSYEIACESAAPYPESIGVQLNRIGIIANFIIAKIGWGRLYVREEVAQMEGILVAISRVYGGRDSIPNSYCQHIPVDMAKAYWALAYQCLFSPQRDLVGFIEARNKCRRQLDSEVSVDGRRAIQSILDEIESWGAGLALEKKV